jgi:glycosidase
VTAHLDDLRALGVDAVWLSPFYRSPQKDAGYDVADYRDVDPCSARSPTSTRCSPARTSAASA